MRIGPRVQPDPRGDGLPRVAFGIVAGAAVVLLGLFGGPEPEDAARSVAAEASYRAMQNRAHACEAKVRCVRQWIPAQGDEDPADNLGQMRRDCGIRR